MFNIDNANLYAVPSRGACADQKMFVKTCVFNSMCGIDHVPSVKQIFHNLPFCDGFLTGAMSHFQGFCKQCVSRI